MKRKAKSARIIATVLLVFAAVLPTIPLAHATTFPASGGLMFVDPQDNSFPPPYMTVGSTFDVNISLFNITGIAGIEFYVTWDPTLLNCTNMTEVVYHKWTPSADWGNIQSVRFIYNNTGGYAYYAQLWGDLSVAREGGYAPGNITTTTNPPNGTQTVATLTMMVVKLPTMAEGSLSCPLNITVAKVGDMDANSIINSDLGIGNPPQSGTYTIKFRIPADINGDGSVNILDAILFENYFGMQQGEPGWNANADINPDGKINILDLIMVAENFGKNSSS
jgi:hypothetical protein